MARLNFSPGDFAGHQRLIENLRAAARRMALLRLPLWTIAVSPQSRTCRQLQFSYGVAPVHEPSDPESSNDYVRNWVRQQHLPGGFVLPTAGIRTQAIGSS